MLPAVPSDPISAAISSSGNNVAGSEFILTCTISEDITGLVAMPTAIWLNPDSEPVLPGNDITIATPPPSDRVAITTLTFNPLKTSHNGEYTCSGTITSLAQEGTIAVSERGDVSVQSKQLFESRPAYHVTLARCSVASVFAKSHVHTQSLDWNGGMEWWNGIVECMSSSYRLKGHYSRSFP